MIGQILALLIGLVALVTAIFAYVTDKKRTREQQIKETSALLKKAIDENDLSSIVLYTDRLRRLRK